MGLVRKTAAGLLVSLVPLPACANGGLPIIFLVNTYAFIVGMALVLIIETRYLGKLFADISTKEITLCVVKFNLWSAIFGVLAIPLFMLIIQLDPINHLVTETDASLMTLVWWSSFSVDLLIAYIATVFIEYKILRKAPFTIDRCDNKALLGHVIRFNLMSYAALVLLVAVTAAFLID